MTENPTKPMPQIVLARTDADIERAYVVMSQLRPHVPMDGFVARVLYVDDLVTDAESRSLAHGAALLQWLRDFAREAGCEYLELDSGVHRAGAHRFYVRHGLSIIAYHFRSEPLQETVPSP